MRNGWKETRLLDIAAVVPLRKKIKRSEYRTSGLLPVVDQGQKLFAGFTDEGDARIDASRSLVVFGDHTRAVKFIGQDFAPGADGIKVLRAKRDVHPGWLYATLCAAPLRNDGYSRHFLQLKEMTFLLPPLAEQKRIVDVIESVDAYVAGLESYATAARAARAALLHELLTTNTKGWKQTTLGEVAEVTMGRQLSPGKMLGTRPRPYLRAANLGPWGIDFRDVLEMDFTEAEEKKFACKPDDILLVEGGNEKSVGCPALVDERHAGLCIQNTIIRCRVKDERSLYPPFLYQNLRNSFIGGVFGQLCAGTTIMHLGQKRAFKFDILLPPLAEQKRIVDVIKSVDAAISAADTSAADARNLRSGLLSDLLSGDHEIPQSYDRIMESA